VAAVAAAVLALALAAPAAARDDENRDDPFADQWLQEGAARLQALDKVTGRTSDLSVSVGQPVRFGTLDIVLEACYQRPPELPPDSAAFLAIDEHRDDAGQERRLFSGWMFASSPGLSTLEHPTYDVIVLNCVEQVPETAEAPDAAAPGSAGQAAGQASDEDAPVDDGDVALSSE